MSIEAMNAAYLVKVGSPTRKAVLIVLANAADHKGQCFPSINYISQKTELSKRAVQSNLRQLESDGFLRVTHRSASYGTRSNLYTLNMEPQQEGVQQVQGGVQISDIGGAADAPITITNSYIDSIGAQDEFSDFLKVRKLKKAPWTDRAAKQQLKNLQALSSDPNEQRKIIAQSADKGWTIFYALRSNSNGAYKQSGNGSNQQPRKSPATRNKEAAEVYFAGGRAAHGNSVA